MNISQACQVGLAHCMLDMLLASFCLLFTRAVICHLNTLSAILNISFAVLDTLFAIGHVICCVHIGQLLLTLVLPNQFGLCFPPSLHALPCVSPHHWTMRKRQCNVMASVWAIPNIILCKADKKSNTLVKE